MERERGGEREKLFKEDKNEGRIIEKNVNVYSKMKEIIMSGVQ